jgi:heme/copper-type cytochrome/quinol oxidase subunit 2
VGVPVSMFFGAISRVRFIGVASLFAALVLSSLVLVAQSKREFNVVGRSYAFNVSGTDRPEIRVGENDLVHITFAAEDIAHSFTIEDKDGSHYRIMRRAEPGRPVSFDFRADKAGTFRFFCSLTIDEKCKDMQGSLIVTPKAPQ